MRKDSSERILEWAEKIKEQKLSDKGIAAWCAEQNISPNTFQYWKKRIKTAFPQTLTKSSFLEIPDDKPIIEVSIHGIRITISKDFDRFALENFLSLLKYK